MTAFTARCPPDFQPLTWDEYLSHEELDLVMTYEACRGHFLVRCKAFPDVPPVEAFRLVDAISRWLLTFEHYLQGARP